MSEYEYEKREEAKENERKRKSSWEDYKNSPEWKKKKEEDRGITQVQIKGGSVK